MKIAVSLNNSAGQLESFYARTPEEAAEKVARKLGTGEWLIRPGDSIEFADLDDMDADERAARELPL